MHACQFEFKNVIELLLSSSADANIVDINGKTAVSISKSNDIRLLIEDAMSDKYILK
jgi:ankyrin repeat protein